MFVNRLSELDLLEKHDRSGVGFVFQSRVIEFVDAALLFLYNTRINKTVRPFYPPPTIR